MLKESIKHFKSLQKRYTTQHNGKQCEYVKTALLAMEKQEKLKPVPFKRTAHDFCNGRCEETGRFCEFLQQYNHEYQYVDYKCPVCNKRVSDGNPNNCCHCGQALDWSKEWQ